MAHTITRTRAVDSLSSTVCGGAQAAVLTGGLAETVLFKVLTKGNAGGESASSVKGYVDFEPKWQIAMLGAIYSTPSPLDLRDLR